MGRQSKWEYFRAVYVRYRRADRRRKQRISDEFCANTRYQRKYALRLLNGPPPGRSNRPQRRSPDLVVPAVVKLARESLLPGLQPGPRCGPDSSRPPQLIRAPPRPSARPRRAGAGLPECSGLHCKWEARSRSWLEKFSTLTAQIHS